MDRARKRERERKRRAERRNCKQKEHIHRVSRQPRGGQLYVALSARRYLSLDNAMLLCYYRKDIEERGGSLQ